MSLLDVILILSKKNLSAEGFFLHASNSQYLAYSKSSYLSVPEFTVG